ncbi:MOSC domain-containing protein [Rhodocyclaceae bacterium]
MIATATLFMGGIRPLPPDNKPTGIFKAEIVMPAWVGKEGLIGDAQADRRVHGGPNKALHQYPVAHYARLATAFPVAREQLVPGSLGENLSVPGWDESNICIGDTFRLGDAVIQLSQPRSPCWKIDQRYGVEGMAKRIDEEGITGWYFRILEEGSVEPGCAFELIDRVAEKVTVQTLLAIWHEHRPDPARLAQLAATPGLSDNWIQKLRDRAQRLESLAT